MQIIPALYIKDGKAAIYRPGITEDVEFLPDSPYDILESLCDHRIRRVHLIDVDSSLPGDQNNASLIGSLSNTSVPELEVGGGIQDMEYLKSLQYAGVDYFVLGSVVYTNFKFLEEISEAEHVPNDKIMISLDVLDGKLTLYGWTEEVDDSSLRVLIRKGLDHGFSRFICTDINTNLPDKGPDFALYESLVKQFPEAIFSAGGNIRTFADVDALRDIGVREAIVGDEIYKQEELLDAIFEYNDKEEKLES